MISQDRATRIARAHACEGCGEYSYKKLRVLPAAPEYAREFNERWCSAVSAWLDVTRARVRERRVHDRAPQPRLERAVAAEARPAPHGRGERLLHEIRRHVAVPVEPVRLHRRSLPDSTS